MKNVNPTAVALILFGAFLGFGLGGVIAGTVFGAFVYMSFGAAIGTFFILFVDFLRV